jgi:hypothetical protein
VQDQAYVLAYIDGFMVLGFAVIGALLLMLLLPAPPAGAAQAARTRNGYSGVKCIELPDMLNSE